MIKDRARQRVLKAVRSEWRKLCDSGWRPTKDLPDPSQSTALERQMARLSKIEEKEWNSMQKHLFKDIKEAAQVFNIRAILLILLHVQHPVYLFFNFGCVQIFDKLVYSIVISE